jgi:serpin B
MLKVEKSGNVHHQFQKLMTELNKPTDAYEMKIANGLFGEKTFQFLQVSVTWLFTTLICILHL